jgi:hypothetical protein
LWLLRTGLKAETENEIKAAQDHDLQTKYLSTKVLKGQYTANA